MKTGSTTMALTGDDLHKVYLLIKDKQPSRAATVQLDLNEKINNDQESAFDCIQCGCFIMTLFLSFPFTSFFLFYFIFFLFIFFFAKNLIAIESMNTVKES